MEMIFLGTSAGMPTKTRNVSGLAIRRVNSKKWCLVDCGEATQHRILHTNLSLTQLEAIFITHVHGDHCYGLPGLLASAATSGRTEPLWIVGPSDIKTFIEAMQTATQLNLSYELKYKCIDDPDETLTGLALEFDIETVPLSHRVPSCAYCFTENALDKKLDINKLDSAGIPRGPNWGLIQQGIDVVLADGRSVQAQDYLLATITPRKIIIAGDNDSPALLTYAVQTANVLVHEATYTLDVELRIGKAPQHSTANAIAQFAADQVIPNLVLTHFSPRYQYGNNSAPSIGDIEAEAKAVYSQNLFLANDLDVYLLNKQGVFVKR
jgi:ribonuclease Z